jgi:hypothetical protein
MVTSSQGLMECGVLLAVMQQLRCIIGSKLAEQQSCSAASFGACAWCFA